MYGFAWNGSHLHAEIVEFPLRAYSAVCTGYHELLDAAVGIAKRIIRSINEDHGGFHRASCAFMLRRMVLLAHFAHDRELDEAIAGIQGNPYENYRRTGEHFMDAGHHCAGYLAGQYVLECVPRQEMLSHSSV